MSGSFKNPNGQSSFHQVADLNKRLNQLTDERASLVREKDHLHHIAGEQKELNRKLHTALIDLRDRAAALQVSFNELTMGAHTVGVVLHVNEPRNAYLIEDLAKGTQVLYTQHPYRNQVGTIEYEPDSYGQIAIKFNGRNQATDNVRVMASNGHVSKNLPFVLMDKPLGLSANVAFNGSVMVLPYGPELAETIAAGVFVLVNPQTFTISAVTDDIAYGEVARVKEIVDFYKQSFVLVEAQGTDRLVYSNPVWPVEVDSRVVLDPTGTIIIHDLGKEEPKHRFSTTKVDVDWSEVVGLEGPRQILQEAAGLYDKKAEAVLRDAYSPANIKGVLLVGPPGCGKTHLVRALATQMGNHYGVYQAGFFYIAGPEILNKFIGESERAIRDVFRDAKRYEQKNNAPSVIFFDDCEALFRQRGTGISSDVADSIVPTILTQMDGLEDSRTLVVFATNRADALDEALMRDKRIGAIIKVPRPSKEVGKQILLHYLKGKPMQDKGLYTTLARTGIEAIFDSRLVLWTGSIQGQSVTLRLSDIISGAMLAGVVDRATQMALHRDLSKGLYHPSGIREDDMKQAVGAIYEANKGVNHNMAILEMLQKLKE